MILFRDMQAATEGNVKKAVKEKKIIFFCLSKLKCSNR